MSKLFGLGLQSPLHQPAEEPRTSHVVLQSVLRRVLNFTGHTIDDIINSPVARRDVRTWFKLHKFVERRSEVVELERQWNPLE
jgi:hypothetical protein